MSKLETNRMLTLLGVAIGQKVKLVNFAKDAKSYRHRLLAMGLTPGVVIKVLSKAPLGGPIQLEIRGYQLSLRPSECQQIAVEGLNERCGDKPFSADHCVCR